MQNDFNISKKIEPVPSVPTLACAAWISESQVYSHFKSLLVTKWKTVISKVCLLVNGLQSFHVQVSFHVEVYSHFTSRVISRSPFSNKQTLEKYDQLLKSLIVMSLLCEMTVKLTFWEIWPVLSVLLLSYNENFSKVNFMVIWNSRFRIERLLRNLTCAVSPAAAVQSSNTTPLNLWVMSHMWMSHVTHMNASFWTCQCIMSHMWMSHVTHMNASCRAYECVMSHMNASCRTYEWVMSMNESCHTYEWVMSCITTQCHAHTLWGGYDE